MVNPKPIRSFESTDDLVKKLRLILMAMCGGLFMMCVVAAVMAGSIQNGPDPTLFAVIIGALAVMQIGAYPVIRQAITRPLREKLRAEGLTNPHEPPAEVLQSYATLTIIAAAMSEGVGLFAAVCLMLTGAWWLLAFALAALVVPAAILPSSESVRRFAEDLSH